MSAVLEDNVDHGGENLYRISAAMKKLTVSRSTIYRLVNAGKLELVVISPRRSGITMRSVHEHIERGKKITTPT